MRFLLKGCIFMYVAENIMDSKNMHLVRPVSDIENPNLIDLSGIYVTTNTVFNLGPP